MGITYLRLKNNRNINKLHLLMRCFPKNAGKIKTLVYKRQKIKSRNTFNSYKYKMIHSTDYKNNP